MIIPTKTSKIFHEISFAKTGARALAPVFAKEISWKILEVFVGIIMLVIAFSLFFY